MKKLTILMCLICFTVSMLLSACSNVDGGNTMVKYQRKFQNLGNPTSQPAKKKSYAVIDLSDGKKVNYDAPIGPSFDIKY